jgi:hypothetical protein
MLKKILPFALLLVPLLVGCPELNDKPSPSPSSSPVTLTAKQKTIGGCNNLNQCVPNVYTLYYTDGSYRQVNEATYTYTKIGDPQ